MRSSSPSASVAKRLVRRGTLADPAVSSTFLEALADPKHEEHVNYVRWNAGESLIAPRLNI